MASFGSHPPPCTETNVAPSHSNQHGRASQWLSRKYPQNDRLRIFGPAARFGPGPCTATACSNAGRFCWCLRQAVSAAAPSMAQARDSLSIVLSPLLLVARIKPPPRTAVADDDRGTWSFWVTRRQLLYRRSSHRRERAIFRRADPGSACTGSPRGKSTPPQPDLCALPARHSGPSCTEARRASLPCSTHAVA